MGPATSPGTHVGQRAVARRSGGARLAQVRGLVEYRAAELRRILTRCLPTCRSVGHASTLDHYRSAEETSPSAAAGTASTEDLRLAMIDYRALFRDLVRVSGQVAYRVCHRAAASMQSAWQADDAGTEELRVALQNYRAFWNRLEDLPAQA
jgi:hypothetical protein